MTSLQDTSLGTANKGTTSGANSTGGGLSSLPPAGHFSLNTTNDVNKIHDLIEDLRRSLGIIQRVL